MYLNGENLEKVVEAKVIVLTRYVQPETITIVKYQSSRITFYISAWISVYLKIFFSCIEITKVCLYGSDHTSKMSVMPIYGYKLKPLKFYSILAQLDSDERSLLFGLKKCFSQTGHLPAVVK